MKNFAKASAAVAVFAMLASCASTSDYEKPDVKVATGSIEPGTSVMRGTTSVPLHKGSIVVGKPLPDAVLADAKFSDAKLGGPGPVRLVSVVPSIDTKVCEAQTHELGESPGIDPKVSRITVSRDLPVAQRRFAEEAKLTNVNYLSDYRSGSFGKATGLLMTGSELLARAVFVLDQNGVVRYLQVVPDVTQLPDMPAAIAAANRLATAQ